MRRRGRPPAGVRTGERVKDYPQLSVRVPPVVLDRLAALASIFRQPQWRVVSRALERLADDLSPEERQRIDAQIERKRKHPSRRGVRP